MATRKRMTWATPRNAGEAPADPGYGTEDQDHPAHQPEPGYTKYKKGDPAAWAETPNPPPYPEGNPPALPGYDGEDQDHPAHKRNPRVPKLSALIQKRASKCMHIAEHMLGEKATKSALEYQALDLMDMSDNQIEATLSRMGDFMGMDDDLMDEGFMGDDLDDGLMDDDLMGMEDILDEDIMGCDGLDGLDGPGDMVEVDDFEVPAGMEMFASKVMAQLKALATQNSYPGATQGAAAKSPEQAKAEAKAVAAAKAHSSAFDGMDTDRDGVVTAEDWSGSKAVFASIDADGDGIIAKTEYVKAFTASDDKEDDKEDKEGEAKKASDALANLMAGLTDTELDVLRQASDDEDEDEDDDDDEKEAAKKKAGKIPPQFLENIKKKKDDKGDDKEDDKDEKKDEKDDDKEAGKKKASDDDDEDDDKAEKEAAMDAAYFANDNDLMGLGDGTPLTASDDALLNEIFASQLPDGHEASMDLAAVEAALKPQPKQASTGSTHPVGNMVRTASNQGPDLASLWKTAPDVRAVFGINTDE